MTFQFVNFQSARTFAQLQEQVATVFKVLRRALYVVVAKFLLVQKFHCHSRSEPPKISPFQMKLKHCLQNLCRMDLTTQLVEFQVLIFYQTLHQNLSMLGNLFKLNHSRKLLLTCVFLRQGKCEFTQDFASKTCFNFQLRTRLMKLLIQQIKSTTVLTFLLINHVIF